MGKRTIAIVGTGSVAAAVGWNLAKLGFDFYFIGRGGPVQATFKFSANGHVTAFESKVPDVLSNTGLVFFCVKAYDLAEAFKHLDLFPHEVVAVSLANGAVQQLIEDGRQAFKQHVFRTGYSTVAVNRQKNDVFVLRSINGEFQFGPLRISDCVTEIEKELVVKSSPFVWNPRIKLYQQRKWLFNTVINTLTAANRLGCNGDLLVDMPMLTAVFGEAYQLGEELWGPWSFSRNDLFAGMLKLIEDTASNENSMAADVRNGRKTESLYLAGLAQDKDCSRYPLLSSLHTRIQSCGFKG